MYKMNNNRDIILNNNNVRVTLNVLKTLIRISFAITCGSSVMIELELKHEGERTPIVYIVCTNCLL